MHDKRFPIRGVVACFVLALLAAPAGAGIDVDFGAAVSIGDDTDLYFAISSRYFDRDRPSVESWWTHCHHPDDLAVALFISKRSGRSPDFVFSLRKRGLSWWEISARVGLPAGVWFVPVTRDPGPPYGKAYGHWKKQKRNPEAVFTLTDGDIRNLVAVRMVHEYYGVPVEVAMEWRASGRDLRALVSAEYKERHGKAGAPRRHSKDKGTKHPGRKHGKGR